MQDDLKVPDLHLGVVITGKAPHRLANLYPPEAAVPADSWNAIALIREIQGVDFEASVHAFAAAFTMLHRLDDVIEDLQPDGWDDGLDADEAKLWRGIWRAWLQGKGAEVPGHLQQPPIGAAPPKPSE